METASRSSDAAAAGGTSLGIAEPESREDAPVRADVLSLAPERRMGGDTFDGLLLRNLLSTAPIGIAFYDRELRFLRINEVFAEMNGLPAAAHLGRTTAELRLDPADPLREILQSVLATSEPLWNVEVHRPIPHPRGGERYWLASCYPVRDERQEGEIAGLGAIVLEITERKQAEAERERLLRELTAAAKRQRRFVREMLAGVTGGRLSLCDVEEDLPKPLPAATDRVPLSTASLRYVRQDVQTVASGLGFKPSRWQDLETAVGEAAMNAIVHAGGGKAWICSAGSGSDRLQVWIQDDGNGIAEDRLHRATLERGFTTAGTLGHGFWMMLQTADRTHLLTGPTGTTVVLEQYRTPPPLLWFQGF